MKHISIYPTLFFIIFFTCKASCQFSLDLPYPNEMIEITLQEGERFIGQYRGIRDSLIVIGLPESGEVLLREDQISYIDVLPTNRFFKGQYWPEFPNSHYYFLIPAAYGTGRRGAFYRNDLIFFNNFSYHFNDYFSMGLTLDALFIGAASFGQFIEPFVALTPKVTLPIKLAQGIDFATGAYLLNIPAYALDDNVQNTPIDAALVYGVSTIGNSDRNLSLGFGYSYAENRWATNPTLMLGGSLRMNRKLAVVVEAWVFPQYDARIGTLGFKYLGRFGSWQLAIPAGNAQQETSIIFIPLISYSFRL